MRLSPPFKRLELRRRNAEPEQRRRLVHEPADVPLLEQRRDLLVEDLALLVAALGLEHALRVAPVRARKQMPRGDEAAEQALPVDVAAEVADAPAARCGRGFPSICASPRRARGAR